jgi:hypothetical protein
MTWAIQRRADAEALLDAYAHELAEEIRAEAAAGALNAEEYGSHGNVLEAADLIDPSSEVGHGPC